MTTYIVEVAIEVEAESREYAESLISDTLNEYNANTTITCVTEKGDHQPNHGGYREPAKTSKTSAQVWLDRAKIRLEEARLREIEDAKEAILNRIFLQIKDAELIHESVEFPIQIKIGLSSNGERAISELNSEGWDIQKILNTCSYTVNLKE